jgi:hypothetical protein
MPQFPGAQWRPLALDWAKQPKMKRHDLIILHTMVGSLDGTDTYFRSGGYGGVESHFGVGGEGRALQWQDTNYQAEANLAGNARAISIETEDRNLKYFPVWNSNDGSAVPAWTDAQVDEIASIVAWCCTVHDIPCQLVHDSKPSTRGIAYHRLGVDGNFPDHRVPGGEAWSSAVGKVCPGNRRIAQMPKVVEKARRIMGGASTVEPVASRGGTVIPVILPRTDTPTEGTESHDWPYREEVIDLGQVGGWRGRCYVRLSFGHPGGQVFRAHFDTSVAGKAAVFHVPGVGEWPGQFVQPAYANGNRWTIEAPAGPTALMITYAAPGGASLSVEWEH